MRPALVLDFPESKVGLNDSCLVAPKALLVVGATSLIWRVGLSVDGMSANAAVWLAHDNMTNRPGDPLSRRIFAISLQLTLIQCHKGS